MPASRPRRSTLSRAATPCSSLSWWSSPAPRKDGRTQGPCSGCSLSAPTWTSKPPAFTACTWTPPRATASSKSQRDAGGPEPPSSRSPTSAAAKRSPTSSPLRRRRHAALPAGRSAAPDERDRSDLDRATQPDRNRRGIALEHLALRMLGWIGLTNVRWRVRPGAQAEEIDGTAHAMSPSFARWQVQAKNTARLDADDAAKEIGLAVANGAAVVMLITTGEFTAAARSVIERAERRSGLAVICLDGGRCARYRRRSRATAEQAGPRGDACPARREESDFATATRRQRQGHCSGARTSERGGTGDH